MIITCPTTDDTTVFPLAKNRPISNRSSRIMYESNIANLIRQVIDVDGFLISTPETPFGVATSDTNSELSKLTLNKSIEFNLYGYYFRINASGLTIDNLDLGSYNLYAAIKIDSDTDEISNQDANDKYEGLRFYALKVGSTDKIADDETAILHIGNFGISKDETNALSLNWSYAEDSYLKFNVDSFGKNVKFIDGKR